MCIALTDHRDSLSSFTFETFHVMHYRDYLKDYQVGNLSFAARAAQQSKVKGKCRTLNVLLGAAANESHLDNETASTFN